MPGSQPQRQRKPWYLRPLPIIAILGALLVTLATIPPLLAGPTPVHLNEQGQQNAEADGWQSIELGVDADMELFGGLVSLQSHALQKNDDNGTPLAGYTWATVKIPAMLPRDVVEDRLRETSLEAVTQILNDFSVENGAEGMTLDTEPLSETTYTGNDHDTRLTRYRSTARVGSISDGALAGKVTLDEDLRLHGEAFIATWRCSILGSYALALAVARDEVDLQATLDDAAPDISQDPTAEEIRELMDLEDLDADDLDPDALERETQITIDEITLKRSGADHLQEIQDRLLAHTLCGEP